MQAQLRQMQEAEAQRNLAEAQEQLYRRQGAEASNRSYIRKRAGELATSGDCVNARQIASANGEFQLHAEVDAYCKTQNR